ncbi:hypothetical protein BIT28_06835 [Photobacterium proteolyticum]|uniref:Autotransporter domain-containing protein n=2 Tax=Photobacterium proteolyticum TaxID=1903952 RepID=A0A1Q9GES3_9GAMM|nr:hypothetical protein BIT28_06835 [Photobacterium proteolyticum]
MNRSVLTVAIAAVISFGAGAGNARAAELNVADRAVAGGADATESYVIRRLQEQAEADNNIELLDLLASASTDAEAAQLAAELTPDRSGANIYGVIQAQDLFTNALSVRITDYLLGNSARNSVWVSFLSSDYKEPINTQGTNRYDGVDSTANGFAVGYEKMFSEATTLGVAISQQKVKATSRLYKNETDIDSYQAAIYGMVALSDLYFSGRGVVGWNANTSSRTIGSTTGYDEHTDAFAMFNSQNIALELDVIYPLYWQDFTLLPTLSTDYTWVKVEDYAENYVRTFTKKGDVDLSSGSPAALAYDTQHYQELNLGMGVELAHSYSFDYGVIQTRLGASASFEVLDDELTKTARLASGGESFTVGVKEREDTRYQAHATLLWETNGSVAWSLSVEREWDAQAENMMVYGRALYAF